MNTSKSRRLSLFHASIYSLPAWIKEKSMTGAVMITCKKQKENKKQKQKQTKSKQITALKTRNRKEENTLTVT